MWRHPLPPDYLEVPPSLIKLLQHQISSDRDVARALQNQFDTEIDTESNEQVRDKGHGLFSAIGKLGTDVKEKLRNGVSNMRGKRYASLTAEDEFNQPLT